MKYEAGKKYRVTREGARFEGLLLFGEGTISGWSRRINKGEILTCLGWSESEAVGLTIRGINFTGPKVPGNFISMQVWPFESLFRPYPLEGLLEEVSDTVEQVSEDLIEDGEIIDLSGHLEDTSHLVATPPATDEILDLTGAV